MNKGQKFTKFMDNLFYKVIDENYAIMVNNGNYPSIEIVTVSVALHSSIPGEPMKPASGKDFQVAFDTVKERLTKLAYPPMTNPHVAHIINK